MQYDKHNPCSQCPFRKGPQAVRLTPQRAKDIGKSEEQFPCHKTTKADDEGELHATPESKHCAGFLIYREKLEKPNQAMRIAERLGLYDPQPFIDSPHKAEVIDHYKEMINDHKSL